MINQASNTTTTTFAILIAIIIVAGVLGNLFVVGVIVYDRKMLASPVNQLLLQLAIADMGNLIFCSPDAAMALLDRGWLLPNVACPIIRFLQEYSLYASVLFQMTIGIERFMAICTPMRMQRFSSRTTIIVTSGIWTMAAAFAFPYFLHMGIVHHFCYWMNIGNKTKLLFKYAEFLVLYALPLVMLTGVYTVMGRVLWGSSETIASEQQQVAILKLRRSVVKMLIISMLLYFLCYTPIQGLFIMEAFFNVYIALPKWLRLLFNALSVMSSSLNPIVYIMCCRHFHSRFMAIVRSLTNWTVCCTQSSYSFVNGNTDRATGFSRSPYVSLKRYGFQMEGQSVSAF
ncbi:hypothetical protein Q1695_001012 [Nippostrongylus brasiliensis]|nr:hypothetical protein Q1695_001012 [Nippostrongylus brasiliensis]